MIATTSLMVMSPSWSKSPEGQAAAFMSPKATPRSNTKSLKVIGPLPEQLTGHDNWVAVGDAVGVGVRVAVGMRVIVGVRVGLGVGEGPNPEMTRKLQLATT